MLSLGARMNWRLVTIINVMIALITVGAVIFDLTRPRNDRSSKRRRQPASQANSARSQSSLPEDKPEERAEKVRIESVDDLANARVDDLGAVPAAGLTELMRRATAEQLAAMALKFNDAPTDARTFGGMGVFFQAWAEFDPEAALAGAFRIDDVAMRKLAARTVVLSVSPSSAPEAIAFLTQHPDKDLISEYQNELVGNLISNWSQLDPEAASRFIDGMVDDKKNSNYGVASRAKSDIAYNWATLDPSAALEWAGKQNGKDAGYGFDLYDSVIRGWCRKDVATASAYVAQHLNDPDLGYSASTVVTALFDQNVEDTRDWISRMPGGGPRNEAERTFASLWAEKDPRSAANWVASLPADEQRNVISTVARNWVETDWPDASRWIATLTGDTRDQALAVAARRENATPGDSLSVAMSIGDDQIRNNVVESVIRNWAAIDPNAADTWVKAGPFSDEQRDHLSSVISEMRQQTSEAERVIITE